MASLSFQSVQGRYVKFYGNGKVEYVSVSFNCYFVAIVDTTTIIHNPAEKTHWKIRLLISIGFLVV